MQGHYSSYIVIILIIAAIVGFCTVFCGTQLGWTHLFTIVGLIVCAVSVLYFIWVMIKLLRLRNHRLFRKYGSAETIAESISQGMKDPLYMGRRNDLPFDLLVTERFIVNANNYQNYLELKDIQKIRPTFLPDTYTIMNMGNPLMSAAATVATNYVSQKYKESQGINENTRYDFLQITDTVGVTHDYSIRRSAIEPVLQILSEHAPQAQIVIPQRS